MAKVRKRANSYQIDYFDPDGKRVRKSFKKRKDAEAELGKRVSLIAEGRYLDVKKDYKTTFGELLDKYKENYKQQSSFKTWKRFCLKNFRDYFNEDTLLSGIKYVHLETYRNHLRQKITKNKTIRAVASVNREMSCLHHIFTKAVEWEMIEKSPFERGGTLLEKENNSRLRYLSEDEIDRLLKACPKDYLRDIIINVLNTGMRRKEVLSLKRDQIRDDFIYLSETKTGEGRAIPVNDDLAELFANIKRRNQLKSEYMFCDEKGRRFREIKRSFNSALKGAGITGATFHTLRHSYASHFVMRGGSLKDLQEILGHKTMNMTMRYAHLSHEHKKKAANLLNGLTASKPADDTCHKTVTFSNQPVSDHH